MIGSNAAFGATFESNFVVDSTNILHLDTGPIANLTSPVQWNFFQEKGLMGLGARCLIRLTPRESESTCLSIFYRGVPIGDKAAETFLKILNDRPALTRAQVLSAQEIRALADVMNRTTVGDNQFSNPNGNPPAAFKMRSAQTLRINGRTVLEVDGCFVDLNGGSIKDFRGIYANGGSGGKRIYQVFLQTRTEEFPKYLRHYKAAINSIQWK